MVVSMGVHIHRVDTEIISGEPQTLKHLAKRQLLSVPHADHLVRGMLHLALNEPEEMLLVHAGRVMNMCVDLPKKDRVV